MHDRDELYVLAVDLGTGGPKIGLVSVTGIAAWQTHVPVETTYGAHRTATQDAEAWWTIIAGAAKQAFAETTIEPSQVVGVGITAQWASTIPVDAAGLPVGDCVMWMDGRGGKDVRRRIGGRFGGYSLRSILTWLRRAGAPPSLGGDDAAGHLAFFSGAGSANGDLARWFLEPADYLSMRFTGVAAASPASMCAAWLIDTRVPGTCAYDQALIRRLGIDGTKLPPLMPTGSVVGTVTDHAALETGLLAGTPVVTGLPDLHSATIGSGAVGDFEPHLAISTTSWLSCPVTKKKTDISHSIATVPGVTPDRYLVVDNQDSGGRCLDWYRESFRTAFDDVPSYEELLALAETAPAGAGNVVFTPWLAGERTPISDRHARAGFQNLGLATTGAHLARAVLEGVAMNSRWLLEEAERFTGRRLEPIRIIGGGAQSPLWCQIMADVTNRTIEQVIDPRNANLRGMALFTARSLGLVQQEEIRGLVAIQQTFEPNQEHRATYDTMFEAFTKLYAAQKKLFRLLNP